MEVLETTAFLGILLLALIVSLFVLSTLSKAFAQTGKTAETHRSWEIGCLIWLVFLFTIAILFWRAS